MHQSDVKNAPSENEFSILNSESDFMPDAYIHRNVRVKVNPKQAKGGRNQDAACSDALPVQ